MTVYAARHRELLREDVTDAELRWLNSRLRPTPGFYGAILLLALLAPRGAVWMFLVVSLASALVPDMPKRERGQRRADSSAS